MPRNRLNELRMEVDRNQRTKSKKTCTKKDTKLQIEATENEFEVFGVIRQWVAALEENTRKCQDIYRKSKNSKGVSKKLKEVFKNSEGIAHQTATALKKIRTELNCAENRTCAEYRMKLIQYTGLVERFKIVATEHEAWAQEIWEDEKRFIQKCHQIVNRDGLDDSELNQLIDDNPQIFTQDYIQNELEARRQLADIEARHDQLVTIEEHLVEIRDLFVNLATLVELQQESLNRVEFFAAQATEHVDEAVGELRSAQTKQRRGRRLKIYILIAVIICAVIILVSVFT